MYLYSQQVDFLGGFQGRNRDKSILKPSFSNQVITSDILQCQSWHLIDTPVYFKHSSVCSSRSCALNLDGANPAITSSLTLSDPCKTQITQARRHTGIKRHVSTFFKALRATEPQMTAPPQTFPSMGDEPATAMGSEFLPTSDSFVSMETNPPTGPIKKYLVNFSMRASHCGLRSGSLWMLITTARPT